jgi:hypothetical protein
MMPLIRPLRRCGSLSCVIFFGFVSLAGAAAFQKHCDPPFNGKWRKKPIDDTCPAEGQVTDATSPELQARHEAQNRVKNELCPSGTPHPITFHALEELQTVADLRHIHYGDRYTLPDRTTLTNFSTSEGVFSEGDVVQLEGYIEHAKRGSGESCNCGETTVNEEDIHVHLTEAANGDRCRSIIVEMIPHYRPDEWHWTHFRDMEGWYVRVTGQLLFDASHRVCTDGKRSTTDPQRMSEWEIHPVYKFEVCNDEYCDQPSSWIDVAQWVKENK